MPEIDKVNVDGVEYDIANKVSSVNSKTGAVTLTASDVGAYVQPSGGIPKTDLASAVQTSLGKADSAYQKPTGGIPSTDLTTTVQTSLGKAESALQSVPSTYRTAAEQDTIDAEKITMPSGGTTGQFLQKTSSGTQWATPSGGGGGSSDYSDLTNKPSINSVTLSGNKTAADLSLAPAVPVVTVSSSGSVSQALDAGKIYNFTGEPSALTITLNQASAPAQYHFCFQSGATATTLTLPNNVVMPGSFQVEASKFYEIDIATYDGTNYFGVASSW